jgi:hypothetical protein
MLNANITSLATLPPEVFEYNWWPEDYDYGGPRFQNWQHRLKARLSECGWNQDDGPPELRGPSVYKHKYVDVYIAQFS